MMQTGNCIPSYIKKSIRKQPERDEHAQTLQMYRVLSSTVKAMIRALQERDYATLIQAGHNVKIVEEIYEQLSPEKADDKENLYLKKLSRILASISTLLIHAKTEDPIFKNIIDRMTPYFNLLLEDLCTSRKQFYLPQIDKRPSRKKLPTIKEDIVQIMANSNSKDTMISGIYLHQITEKLFDALSTSIHLLNFRK